MRSPFSRSVVMGLTLLAGSPVLTAFTVSFSDSDFTNTPIFSGVTTYAFDIEIASSLVVSGVYADPAIADIQYSVSGTLATTPSGFPAFGFALNHIFPLSLPITGTDFYGLNASSIAGETLRFNISPTANLSDGLQVSELLDLGGGVVFQLNAREEGTGRYHPAFIQLRADGTGIIQNADNFGGINPSTLALVDVNVGEEYITNLTFDPAALTLSESVPEPSSTALLGLGGLALMLRRRR